jgi:integrase
MEKALVQVIVQYRPFFYFLYDTGCRIGEACAVTWGDIDFERREITFSKTAKDQIVKSTTKTKTRRTIDMSERLYKILRGLRQEYLRDKLEGGTNEAVFVSTKGRLLSQQTLRRVWHKATKACGLGEFRLHDIRHTTASVLLSRGANIGYVSRLLGHSSQHMTLTRYAHFLPSETGPEVELLQRAEMSGNELQNIAK